MACLYSRVEFKELLQSLPFTGRQVAAPLSQGSYDGPLPADGLLSLFAELHEVMVDHSDDVEAVGYYFGVGEASLDDISVAGAQVHADHLHFLPAPVSL